MKKVLMIIGLALIMIGCNSPLKKSVIAELTTEELKTISDKDPFFLKFYEEYFETPCYQQLLSVKSDQVAYAGVTYKEFYNYYRQISDKDYVKSINEEVEKEWTDKYGYTEKKFDSIIAYWQKYYVENSPETYVDIEFDHATLANSWSNDYIKLFFKLTPKRDAMIKSVWFDLAIKTKEDESKVVLFEHLIGCYKDFSDTIVIEHNYHFYSKNDLYKDLIENKLTNEELLDKYVFEYERTFVETEKDGRIDDKLLSKKVPEIGSYINMLDWDEELHSSKEILMAYSKQSIVRENIDPDYESLDLYKTRCFDEKTKMLNPTCHDFLNYLKRCEILKTNTSNGYEFGF